MHPGDRTRLTCPRRSCPQPQAGQIERLGAAPRPEAPPPPTPRASSRACAKAPGLAAQLTKIDVAHARAKRDASGARDDVAAEGEPRRVMDEGFEAVLSRKHRATPAVVRIFDGEKEAKLIALACCKPPKGRARWTLRLLESKVVELRIVDRASDSTIGRALKKTFSSPSPTVLGHPAQGQRRVRSGDRRRAGRLHAATRSQSSAGLPGRDLKATPRRDASDNSDETGAPARCDYEYERNGTANLFMLFAPLEGWRHIKDRHTAVDYAHLLKDVADIHFSAAQTIVLVQDNLNIHSKASLYQAFPPAEARRLVERFEWHYTPKHGSWLWRSRNSASYRPNVSTAASLTNKPSSRKSPPGTSGWRWLGNV